MNQARDSDSMTHAEKSNPTSRTDSSSKMLRDIFLGHPVKMQLIATYAVHVTQSTNKQHSQS